MTLLSGARLGRFEIVELLGGGGMANVYRARDEDLKRDVALKVPVADVAGDPSRRGRFKREAQAISQLNHPYIRQIHELAEADGIPFLVMEYVDGASLEQRLRLGPLKWQTAVGWAAQIAAALEFAHSRGIVHRDLKPANIIVTPSGIKLLDFGLAKLIDEPDGSAHPLKATESLTAEQKLVGTLHYMSPEQLEGREVDTRTDIFAFGVTFYEMLTARKAFAGASAASVTAAILTSDPPPVGLSASGDPIGPAALDHLIRRAVAKRPDDRWQSAHDLLIELEWIQRGGPRPAGSRPSRRRAWLTTAGVAAIAAAAVAMLWAPLRARLVPPPAATAFSVSPPQGTRFTGGFGVLAVSPDSRKIAFVAGPPEGPNLIWWQALDSTAQHAIAGTDGANGLFWSPDSASIGFYANNQKQLKRVALSGTPPVKLIDLESQWLGTSPSAYWGADDVITFSHPEGLLQIKASGGEANSIRDAGAMPRPLPGGRFMFLTRKTQTGGNLLIAGRGLRDPVEVRPAVGSNAVFASGHLVYRQGQTLVAHPFDPAAVAFTGPAISLAEHVSYNPGNGRTLFDAAADLLVYRLDPSRKLVWRDRQGNSLGSVGQASNDWDPSVARDGSLRVGVARSDARTEEMHIWSVDARGGDVQLTRGHRERFAKWSPDGQWVAYMTIGLTPTEIRRVRSSGAGGDTTMVSGDGKIIPLDYTNDYLIYVTGADDDLFAMPLKDAAPIAGAKPIDLVRTKGVAESGARLSPDGRWLMFTSTEGGQRNLWLQSFPSGANRRRITTTGAFDPNWRDDGGEFYYVGLDGSLYARTFDSRSAAVGAAKRLFGFNFGAVGSQVHVYASSPDGTRFLVAEMTSGPEMLFAVVNWASGLR